MLAKEFITNILARFGGLKKLEPFRVLDLNKVRSLHPALVGESMERQKSWFYMNI